MDGLKVTNANMVVHVHPSKSRNVSRAILRELSSLLFKFHEVFDGVVLAYDVEIADKASKILPGIHPYFGVRLTAQMLIFSPKPNMLLEGKVVKLTQESISVIVLGFAYAVIFSEDIREDFSYKNKNGKHLYRSRSQKHHSIKVGTMIRFVVKSMDEETIHISGSLLQEHTGSIIWLDKHSNDISRSERTIKTRENMSQGPLEGQAAAEDTVIVHSVKKSKKRKVM